MKKTEDPSGETWRGLTAAFRPSLFAAVVLGVLVAILASILFSTRAAVPPPPAGGYFQLVPAGQFATLPSDAQAAAMVKRSSWEPRPENAQANQSTPPATFKTTGYGWMEKPDAWARVTGNFKGTTDETIQWAAAKWGLPDDLIRAQAVAESNWYQNRKDASGKPMPHYGYGDYGHCPATTRYPASGAASYGLMQIKWCAHTTPETGYGTWPWSEDSTAYNLDYYGSIVRGCYEGWEAWLGNGGTGYKAGDLWGCVGRWYSGDWYSSGAQNYISTVKGHLSAKPWRTWADHGAPVPVPAPMPAPSPAPAPAKPADLNADGKVTITDLSILLSNWGKSGPADLNGSGAVDIQDLSILLSRWSA